MPFFPEKYFFSLTSGAEPSDLLTRRAIERTIVSYEVDDGQFKPPTGNPGQFHQLYFMRLQQLGMKAREGARAKWQSTPIGGVIDCQEDQEFAIIGTLYKHMRLKPTVMDEYMEEKGAKTEVNSSRLVSPDDFLYIEDQAARMRIVGGGILDPSRFVTGVVMALKGKANEGLFHVSDIAYPCNAPSAIPPAPSEPAPKGSKVLLCSGLSVGSGPCFTS